MSMTMNSKTIIFTLLAMILGTVCAETPSTEVPSTEAQKDSERFIESFIQYYDFSTAGRYTHEYHPFLFEKSSYSLDAWEEQLIARGWPIKGRIVLTGYA